MVEQYDWKPRLPGSPDGAAVQLESLDHPRIPAPRRMSASGRLSRAEPVRGALLDVRVMLAPALPVIRLRGELDLSNVHQLHDAVDRLAAAGTTGDLVVLDLEGLGFCDARGLTALEEARRKLARLGKDLMLLNPSARMRKLLAATGLDEEFQLASRPTA